MVCSGMMRNPIGLEHRKMNGKRDWWVWLELVSEGPPVPSLDHSVGLRSRRRTDSARGEDVPRGYLGTMLVGLELAERTLSWGYIAVPEFRPALGVKSPPCSRHFSRSWGHRSTIQTRFLLPWGFYSSKRRQAKTVGGHKHVYILKPETLCCKWKFPEQCSRWDWRGFPLSIAHVPVVYC